MTFMLMLIWYTIYIDKNLNIWSLWVTFYGMQISFLPGPQSRQARQAGIAVVLLEPNVDNCIHEQTLFIDKLIVPKHNPVTPLSS